MSVGGELVAILLLALANGLFAAAEIAMLSVRKSQLAERAEDGDRRAEVALELRARPERLLATVQIGITVVSATAAAIGGAGLARHVATPLRGLGLEPAHAEEVALALVIALVSFLSLVFGELVPKSLALRNAERTTLFAARPLALLASLATPLVWLLTASSNLVLRLFRDQTSFSESRLSPDELEQLLDEACVTGSLDRRAGEIAIRALETVGLTVDAVKTPRAEIVALPRADLRAALVHALEHAPHAAYPVVERASDTPGVDGDLDTPIGTLATRDVAHLLVNPDADLASRLHPPFLVTEHRLVLDVLDEMQRTGAPLALVVDEHGVITGLLSLEDLLEELVGEIRDARRREPPLCEREPDGAFIASARMSIRELNRAAGLSLPETDGAATVGGLVIARAGRLPSAGARIELPDVTFEVLETTPRRVLRVRIRPKSR